MDLAALLDSWTVALNAERKSDQTIKAYRHGVRGYLQWCGDNDAPADLSRASVNGYISHLLQAGRAAATARARQLALRRFTAWLTDEGELDADPLIGIAAPKLDKQVVQPLTAEQIRGLLKACDGKTMLDRRDTALVRLMLETGARAGEVAALDIDDVDVRSGTAVVRRGKGGKGRIVPFGPQTGLALDRYLRARRTHRLADTPALWLGDRGRAFTYDGLYRALQRRADAAGISGFHPHLLRHTAAHRWLAAGGSEQGLMAVAGWERPDMLMRYTKAQASARAADEARRLNLGDL